MLRERNAGLTNIVNSWHSRRPIMTAFTWTGQGGTLSVCQCVATLRSPPVCSCCALSVLYKHENPAFSIECFESMFLFSPFLSLGSLSLWTRLEAGMVGRGVVRPAGCRWSWWGRWRAPVGGTARFGASSAWRTGSASELPWKIKKTKHLEVEAKLSKPPCCKVHT